jgi:phage terminase large subunit-like protein
MIPPSDDPPGLAAARAERGRREKRRRERRRDADDIKRSFRRFWDHFWPLIEPTREQLPSVAVEGVTAALQAVADGRIKRLVVEMPPGVGKSKMGPVAFPAWLLLRTNGRARVMAGSYTQAFASRDSMFCRDIVESHEYRELVDGAWELRDDANSKDDWHTSPVGEHMAWGRRLTASITGKATGERCTFQLLDDVLNAVDAASPAKKKAARNWVNDTLPSRLEDQRNDPRVIFGQPLAIDDPIADVIRKGWKHLRLPVVRRADEAPCVLLDDHGVEVWRDTREIGQPLLELHDSAGIKMLKGDMTAGAYRTQYELRRGDDSDATFKRAHWNWYYQRSEDAAANRPAHTDTTRKAVPMPAWFSRVVITCDFKFVPGVGDYASVQAWGESGPDGYLLKSRRGRVGFESSVDWVDDFAKLFPGAEVGIEKAANGHAVIQTVKGRIRNVKGLRPWGKKTQRHAAATPPAKNGHLYLPLGAVFEEVDDEGTVEMVDATEFVEELAGATKFDDQTDAASYAIIEMFGVGGHHSTESDGGQEVTAAATVSLLPTGTTQEEIAALAELL